MVACIMLGAWSVLYIYIFVFVLFGVYHLNSSMYVLNVLFFFGDNFANLLQTCLGYCHVLHYPP